MERSKKKTVGPLSSVACPWCRKSNDLRGLAEMHLLEQGMSIECIDCHMRMVVVRVITMPQVVLGQYHGKEIREP